MATRNRPAVFRVSKMQLGAAQFAISYANSLGKLSPEYEGAVEDIAGGMDAGQLGLVLLISREALEAGLDALIERRGLGSPSTYNRWRLLAQIFGKSSEIYRQAWFLECKNPKMPEQVYDYARACMKFVETSLGLSPPNGLWAYKSQDAYQRAAQLRQEISRLASFLDVRTAWS